MLTVYILVCRVLVDIIDGCRLMNTTITQCLHIYIDICGICFSFAVIGREMSRHTDEEKVSPTFLVHAPCMDFSVLVNYTTF